MTQETQGIYEIPDATFITNETGRVTVFLPAFDGEPEHPRFTLKENQSVLFDRTPETACILSNLAQETEGLLKKSAKCLVIELDLDKVLSILEKEEDAFDESAFKRVYEVSVQKGE